MRFLIKENPATSSYVDHSQYKDYEDFDSIQEAIAYCQELFGDNNFILYEIIQEWPEEEITNKIWPTNYVKFKEEA